MTEHEWVFEKLALAAADALDPDEAIRVQRHAAQCPDCSRELDRWSLYAQSLAQLPQPSAPADLIQRTQARILQARAAKPREDASELTLAVLALFGWGSSWTLWILARMFSGGMLIIFGANLANGFTWSLISTVLVWMTAATAALALRRHRDAREVL